MTARSAPWKCLLQSYWTSTRDQPQAGLYLRKQGFHNYNYRLWRDFGYAYTINRAAVIPVFTQNIKPKKASGVSGSVNTCLYSRPSVAFVT